MNRNFEDAKYYLGRAAENAKAGVKEELEPVQERFREITGREEEDVDESRLEQLQQTVEDLEEQAEGEARRALTSAKDRIQNFRDSRSD